MVKGYPGKRRGTGSNTVWVTCWLTMERMDQAPPSQPSLPPVHKSLSVKGRGYGSDTWAQPGTTVQGSLFSKKKKKYFDFWPQGRVKGTKGPFSSVGNLCVFSLSLCTCFHLNGKEISLRGNKKPDHHSLASHPSSACYLLCLSLLPG